MIRSSTLQIRVVSMVLLVPGSDNYLSLIPGEKRTLKCVVPQQVAEVESVTLTVSGWNVPEKKIKLFLDGMK